MANVDAPLPALPVRCPKCHHEGATVFVSSYTVVTIVCTRCAHPWAVELAALPEDVRKRLLPRVPRSA
jgi:hypothetical protein